MGVKERVRYRYADGLVALARMRSLLSIGAEGGGLLCPGKKGGMSQEESSRGERSIRARLACMYIQ